LTFGYFVERSYPIELEIKDTTDIDNEGRLRMERCGFVCCKLSVIGSNIPAAPAYGVIYLS
jgi:hypothetical protein